MNGLISKRLYLGIIIWFGLIFGGHSLMVNRLPYNPTFPYAEEILARLGPRDLTTWANFDGVHYLTLVEKGYKGTGLIQAFFPLYPLLVRVFSLGGIINPILVGLMISFFSSLTAIYLLSLIYRDEKLIFLLLAFPTAFFFLAFYTESLFLALTLAAVYMAKRQCWGLAGFWGMLAALTRFPGFLVTILLFDIAKKQGNLKSKLALIMLPILGLGLFMAYLWITFDNPIMFLTVQSEFGAQRSQGILIPLITPFYRYLKIFLTVPPLSHAYFISMQELLVTLGGFYLAIRLWSRKEFAWSMFSGFCLLLPTLTGSLSSMPRYTLVIFPLFWELNRSLKKQWWKIIFLVFAILQIINLALFTQGRWVA